MGNELKVYREFDPYQIDEFVGNLESMGEVEWDTNKTVAILGDTGVGSVHSSAMASTTS